MYVHAVFIMTAIVCFSQASTADILTNLQGRWSLEQTTNLTNANAILDSSGNNIHGTGIDHGTANTLISVLGVSPNGSNTRSKALSFTRGNNNSSSTSDDDYITMGNAPRLQFTKDMTISMWVNLGVGNIRWSGMVSWVHDTGYTESGYSLNYSIAGGIEAGVATSSAGIGYNNKIPALSGWHHVVFTYDGSFERIYLDGVLVDSNAKTGNIDWIPLLTTGDPNDGFQLGRYSDDDESTGFTGFLDEVRAYSRALTATDVLELASVPLWLNNAVAMDFSAPPTVNASVTKFTNISNITLVDRTLNGTDVPTNVITATLSVSAGDIKVGTGVGTATVTNNSTSTVGLVGTPTQINVSMAGLSYRGDTSNSGTKTITLVANDRSMTETKRINVNVIDLEISKSVQATSGAQYLTPGNSVLYTIGITNQGGAPIETDSLIFVDALGSRLALFTGDLTGVGSGPVSFTDGTPSSGLAYTFISLSSTTDDVDFSNDNGVSFTYTPTSPNDANVSHIRIKPKGQMNATVGASSPNFSIKFKAKIK